MEKKESYRHILPHFQQPGQAYFITWCLKDSIPRKALVKYSQELKILKAQQDFCKDKESIDNKNIREKYYLVKNKYIKAFNNLLDCQKNPALNLSKDSIREEINASLFYWEGKKLRNLAYAIMPNHIHWVIQLLRKNTRGNLVYLQDILQSVKRFTANKINELENRKGSVWQKESFETTIRDDKHLHYAIEYTINNPVSAGLVENWRDWEGCWCYDR